MIIRATLPRRAALFVWSREGLGRILFTLHGMTRQEFLLQLWQRVLRPILWILLGLAMIPIVRHLISNYETYSRLSVQLAILGLGVLGVFLVLALLSKVGEAWWATVPPDTQRVFRWLGRVWRVLFWVGVLGLAYISWQHENWGVILPLMIYATDYWRSWRRKLRNQKAGGLEAEGSVTK